MNFLTKRPVYTHRALGLPPCQCYACTNVEDSAWALSHRRNERCTAWTYLQPGLGPRCSTRQCLGTTSTLQRQRVPGSPKRQCPGTAASRKSWCGACGSISVGAPHRSARWTVARLLSTPRGVGTCRLISSCSRVVSLVFPPAVWSMIGLRVVYENVRKYTLSQDYGRYVPLELSLSLWKYSLAVMDHPPVSAVFQGTLEMPPGMQQRFQTALPCIRSRSRFVSLVCPQATPLTSSQTICLLIKIKRTAPL